MQVNFTFRGNIYSLDIGYKTPWFEQSYFIMLIQEWRDDQGNVYSADILFKAFKHRKFK